MKKTFVLLGSIISVSSINSLSFAKDFMTQQTPAANSKSESTILKQNNDSSTASQNEKISQFLNSEKNNLSSDFPYRINLPANGQIAKNNAGIRISETAQQLASDTTGLLFYYKLLDHAMRVPHWHANASEVGLVLSGKMQVTIWEGKDKPHVFTIEKNGTWVIPPATLHSLENVANSDLTFLVNYDSPIAADRDFATAWGALPDIILQKSLGLSAEDIANVRKTTINRLSKYDPSATPENIDVSSPFSGNFDKVKPLYSSQLGSIRRVETSDVPKMTTMSLQQTILKPNTMREPHWYLGADTFFYVYEGSAFFTMMNDDGKVYKAILKPGDVVYIPKGAFHTFINIGAKDLVIYEVFEGSKPVSEISLSGGSQNMDPKVLSGATGISESTAKRITPTKSGPTYIIPF